MTHPMPPSRRRPGRPARLFAILCLTFLPTAARAGLPDMRITEILCDPGGGGAQWVELMNAGADPVDLSSAWIGADNSSAARQLAGLTPVPPGGLVVVHWNTSAGGSLAAMPALQNTGHDFYTGPLASLSASHGSLILSRSSNLLDPPSMLAFVQWGAPNQKGADVASSLGLWPANQFLPTVAPGHSQALAPGGSPRSPAGWFEAVTPTPGAVNTAPVSAWRGWRLVGASALTPAAASDLQTDFLDAIGVSTLGSPIHYRFQADAWSSGISLDSTTRLPVALAASGGGNLDVALTAPDGTLFYRRFVAGQWSPALKLGQSALLPPALAYNPAAKELELVVADPAGQLQFARAVDGMWSAWSPIGAVSGPVAPALAINLLDRPFDLLFTAPDGVPNDMQFNAGAWSPSLPAGMQTLLRPAVAVTGADTVELVITAPDHKVYYNHLSDSAWAGWVWTGLESGTAPALHSSPTDDGLELFVSGLDARLLHSRLINGVWGQPWPLGAVTGQPATAAASFDGGLDLLMAGADGSLWHNRFRPASPDLVSLSGKVQAIFDAHCVQCHDAGDPQEGQDLEPDSAYSSTVQIPSMEAPTMHRIEPGSPDRSYLYHKITGTQSSAGGSGARMPRGGRLSDAEIQTIRAWIAQGALDN